MHDARKTRRMILLSVPLSLGLLLSACSGASGNHLAKLACAHVSRSIALYQQAERLTNNAMANKLRKEAISELVSAEAEAGQAALASSRWQALMATVSESSRVPESYLIHALTRQCHLEANDT